jgi:hypothetical protein
MHRVLFVSALPLSLAACGGSPATDIIGSSAPPDATPDAGRGPVVDAGHPDATDGGNPFCSDAEGTYAATRETSNVLFLLDRSGSMQIVLSNGVDTRWSATRTGIDDLLASLPANTRAGAMMFPQGDQPITCCWIDPQINDVACSCAQGELPGVMPRCDEKTYQVGVPIANLDVGQTSAIEGYFASSDYDFYWGTPLAVSLQAAIDAMRASPLKGAKSVVLLTDGYPTSCNTKSDPNANDIQRVVDAASGGVNGQTLVRTFVMGVIDGNKGARADYLSEIAKAGGTGRTSTCDQTNDCFYALNATTFATDIKSAFDEIALQAFDCTFDLPPPKPNTTPDLTKVNVTLTTTTNGTQALSRDTNHQSGWDYLPNQTQFQLYGDGCKTMKSDTTAKVDVVVGCKTQGQ